MKNNGSQLLQESVKTRSADLPNPGFWRIQPSQYKEFKMARLVARGKHKSGNGQMISRNLDLRVSCGSVLAKPSRTCKNQAGSWTPFEFC